ncbi:MAG: type II CAAX endopeptidase family protein [Verrucomicrobiota bacterium]
MAEDSMITSAFGLVLALMIPLSLFAAFYCKKNSQDLKNPLGDTVQLYLPANWTLVLLAVICILPLIPGLGLLTPVLILLFIIYTMQLQNIDFRKLWLGQDEKFLFYIRWTVIIYLAIFTPILIITLSSQGILEAFNVEIEPQQTVEMFLQMEELAQMLIFIFFACIWAPIFEEILFRGFLYPLLKARFNKKIALVSSSVLFGFIHLHLPSIVPLTMLGVVLCFVYEYSGRLILSIMIHALFNLVTILILLLSLSLGLDLQSV